MASAKKPTHLDSKFNQLKGPNTYNVKDQEVIFDNHIGTDMNEFDLSIVDEDFIGEISYRNANGSKYFLFLIDNNLNDNPISKRKFIQHQEREKTINQAHKK